MDRTEQFPVTYLISRANLTDHLGDKALRLTDESMKKIAKFMSDSDQEETGDINLPWELDEDDLEYDLLELKDTAGNPVPNDLVFLPEDTSDVGAVDALRVARLPWWRMDNDGYVVSAQAAEDIAGVSIDDWDDDIDIDNIEKLVPIADTAKRWSEDDGFYTK